MHNREPLPVAIPFFESLAQEVAEAERKAAEHKAANDHAPSPTASTDARLRPQIPASRRIAFDLD